MSKTSDSKEDSSTGSLAGWENVDFSEIELGDQIGGGGVGLIYKGWWRDQPVGLKTLFDSRIGEDLRKEYMDELLVMSKVKHANIVKFMGACMTPPQLCFIMELCECSLYQLLHVERVRMDPPEAIQVAIDVGSAMEYLHSLTPAIIHRDLKSLNILRSFKGTYKVCDFGLVKCRNATAGTPAYMAPELIENRPYNKSVDVYAFGVLLWELMALEMPFYGVDIPDIRSRVVQGARPRIPSYGVPPKCGSLIKRCWHQNAEERPTFPDIVDELLELEKELPGVSYTENVKDSMGDMLDNLMGGSSKK